MDENIQETQKPIEPNQEIPQANASQPGRQAEQPQEQSTNRQKANLGKRFAALLIDIGCCFVVAFIPILGWIAGFIYTFVKDGIDFGGLDNRSIGKKVMGLRVINTETGLRCNYKDSALRQILFIIPIVNMLIALIEIVLVISDDKGIRLGDKIAKTMVIEDV
ncbi:MAG: RDD family protein [Elusimicrobia bacterium]|nr:RDD family protein [Elusimicrobiota bacterium]